MGGGEPETGSGAGNTCDGIETLLPIGGGNGAATTISLASDPTGNATGAVIVFPQEGQGPETPAMLEGTTNPVPQL